jgi:hypothetical protein
MVRRSSVVAVMAVGMLFIGANVARPKADASVTVTFSELNEHGEWYKLPNVGWVWSPYADPDWRPFLYGRWVWTVDGWTWMSYEPFGWISCHYGYWYHDDEMGWLWVPGYEWSPARVRWVVTDYEIGWAPMTPPGWLAPKAFTPAGYRYWVVVPPSRFTDDEVYQHRVVERRGPPHPVKRRIIRQGAPEVGFVKRHVKRPIVRTQVKKAPESAGQKKLIKVHVQGEGPTVKHVAPIGPKFRPAQPRKKNVQVIRGPAKPAAKPAPAVKHAPGAPGKAVRGAPAAKSHPKPVHKGPAAKKPAGPGHGKKDPVVKNGPHPGGGKSKGKAVGESPAKQGGKTKAAKEESAEEEEEEDDDKLKKTGKGKKVVK